MRRLVTNSFFKESCSFLAEETKIINSFVKGKKKTRPRTIPDLVVRRKRYLILNLVKQAVFSKSVVPASTPAPPEVKSPTPAPPVVTPSTPLYKPPTPAPPVKTPPPAPPVNPPTPVKPPTTPAPPVYKPPSPAPPVNPPTPVPPVKPPTTPAPPVYKPPSPAPTPVPPVKPPTTGPMAPPVRTRSGNISITYRS